MILNSGCFIRVGIHDNCDTVSGAAQEKISEVIESLKEQQEENIMDKPTEEIQEEEAKE